MEKIYVICIHSPRQGRLHDLHISFYGDGVAGFSRATPQVVELRHLRYFVAVADDGTFKHAAGQMFIAQPTLS